jgi:hypothetical protein
MVSEKSAGIQRLSPASGHQIEVSRSTLNRINSLGAE